MKRYQTPASERLAANLAALPEVAYVAVCTEKVLCIIKRGESGYYLTDWPTKPWDDRGGAKAFAAEMNQRLGVTKAEAQAMEAGSMYGWSIPAAHPSMWEKQP